LEEIARIVAEGLTRLGHQVTVWCDTPNEPSIELPFRVLRKPSFWEVFLATRNSDVVLMFNMSLKALPMSLLCCKPLVVVHQGWYGKSDRVGDMRAWLKCFLSRSLTTNIACSHAVANYLGGVVTVIPNSYDDRVFTLRPEIQRDRDVHFVGRLVSDKGADLLVEAVGRMAAEGAYPTLTITGSGPEEPRLRRRVAELNLEMQTHFTGPLRGEVLAKEMNRHRVLVVPSLWAEPFGIVALEGIASGCWVIGSEYGGLKDAIGGCGVTFPNGDVRALSACLSRAFEKRDETDSDIRRHHLGHHRPQTVVSGYEAVLNSVIGRRISEKTDRTPFQH